MNGPSEETSRCMESNEEDPCRCQECQEHGPPDVLIGGASHGLVHREDGTGSAWWNWADRPLKGPVHFRKARNGRMLPKDRGKRRRMILTDLAWLHRDSLAVRDPRGPVPVPPSVVTAAVSRHRDARRSIEDACNDAAPEVGLSADRVKKVYGNRNSTPARWTFEGPGPMVFGELSRAGFGAMKDRERLLATKGWVKLVVKVIPIPHQPDGSRENSEDP